MLMQLSDSEAPLTLIQTRLLTLILMHLLMLILMRLCLLTQGGTFAFFC